MIVTVIAQGAMGSGVAARLNAHGVRVLTSLEGRSADSAGRAAKAGMQAANLADIAASDFILSILPPSDAMGLAERLAPAILASTKKPVYADCNAVSPQTAAAIGKAVAATGALYVDGGIIGPPPKLDGSTRTIFYVSGEHAPRMDVLNGKGLVVRQVDGGIGAASALKMSYAAITKGLNALGAASALAAERSGAKAGLLRELSESQPGVLAFLSRGVPDMLSKAYRWVGEMEEIADYMAEPAAASVYKGIAAFDQTLADDHAGPKAKCAVLEGFYKEPKKS